MNGGHSYFNTCYAWPDGFKTYTLAEAYVFEKHLGIWSYRKSRKRYCCGLGEEGKTVYSTTKPYFVAKIQNAEVVDLSKYNGSFVRVRSKIKKIQQLRKGAQLMFLKHKRMKNGLPVISFENHLNWLGLQKICKGDLLQIEVFATLYKKSSGKLNCIGRYF